MAKKTKSEKGGKAKLDAGAAEIRKLEKSAKNGNGEKAPTVEIPKATRPVEEVLRDRVRVMPDHIGLTLDKDTPIEESLQVLDWATSLGQHVGFMIGDIVNFSETAYGSKYAVALNQTGRAYSTLRGYAEVARKIPVEKRRAVLSYSQHREIIRLPDAKIDEVLNEVSKQAEDGRVPSVKELRFKIQKLTPRKRKKSKRVTSGKGKKKDKPEAPPYQPSADEQAKLDAAEEAITKAVDEVKSSKLFTIVGRLDNKEKRRWTDMVLPLVTFYNVVERSTGY